MAKHPPGGNIFYRPPKIIVVKCYVLFVLETVGAEQLGSSSCITGPPRYMKAEDNQKKMSVEFPCFYSATPRSYDQQNKYMN